MHGTQVGRGESLTNMGTRFERRPGLIARAITPGFHKLLDSLDRGLVTGSIAGTLPDGSKRLLGGHAPGHDAVVDLRDWRGLMRLATNGSVGWYQAWAAGEWSSPDPVAVFAVFNANAVSLGTLGRASGPFRWAARAAHWLNRNTHKGAERNIHVHYDLGNDFYAAWLDPTMSYSSAMYADGDDLEAAQKRKWRALSDRFDRPETVLEIGCGWGGLANHFAQNGAQVTAISLSDEQLAWARDRHDPSICFRKQDYRDVTGRYDAIVSVEMVEAVGREYWPGYFECIARNLKHGGRAAIQYIAMRDEVFDAYAASADFIQAYVFPGGLLIRESEFCALAQQYGLIWQDRHTFGMDYARTLAEWRDAFETAIANGTLPAGFDAEFQDLWRYYLMYCEGGFRGGGIDVCQITLVKR